MEPFGMLQSKTFVLPVENIDTDQIIPARFLTTTSREGLGASAFYDWRYDADGKPKSDAALNQVDTSEHKILVAGRNFGCGSSREHAPWALTDFGVRVVISSEIADIFRSNSMKNGLLPIVVDKDAHEWLLENPGADVTVDLENQTLRFGNHEARFSVEAFAKKCLIEGVDQLGYLMSRSDDIDKFEAARA